MFDDWFFKHAMLSNFHVLTISAATIDQKFHFCPQWYQFWICCFWILVQHAILPNFHVWTISSCHASKAAFLSSKHGVFWATWWSKEEHLEQNFPDMARPFRLAQCILGMSCEFLVLLDKTKPGSLKNYQIFLLHYTKIVIFLL